MTKYVLGFCFNAEKNRVVLMEKNRPDWQKGYLNGVGGKVEKGEIPVCAMCREFGEETGVITYAKDWDLCFDIKGYDYELLIFRVIHDKIHYNAKTITDEEIRHRDITRHVQDKWVYNLNWMIPMMVDEAVTFPINIDFKGNPK